MDNGFSIENVFFCEKRKEVEEEDERKKKPEIIQRIGQPNSVHRTTQT